MVQTVRKAVFPVAGMGTRFLPATKIIPKEMLPIIDKPLIQYAVEEAIDSGIEDFIFVTGRRESILLDHYKPSKELEKFIRGKGKKDILDDLLFPSPSANNIFSVCQENPLGLGHAVWCARALVDNEPFAVILPDELLISDPPSLSGLIDSHSKLGGHIVAAMEVSRNETDKYGILEVESYDNNIVKAKGMVEKPKPDLAPSRLANIGRYVLDPCIFDYLGKKEQGINGEIQLTDAIHSSSSTVPLHGIKFNGQRFDCGTKIGFLEASIALSLKRPEFSEQIRELIIKLIK